MEYGFSLSLEEQLFIKLVQFVGSPKKKHCTLNIYCNDWDFLINLLLRHRIYQLIYPLIRKQIPHSIQTKADYLLLSERMTNQLLLNELEKLDCEFKKKGIHYVLLKGFGLAYLLYPDIHMRAQGDLDVLINQEQLTVAQMVLESYGYNCVYKGVDYNKKYLPSGYRIFHYGFHECEYRKKITEQYHLKVELHLTCDSFSFASIQEFRTKTKRLSIGAHIYRIMELDYMFIHLCVNTYGNFESWHGAHNNTYVRDLLEVRLFLVKHGSKIKFGRLFDIAERNFMIDKVLYVLHLVNTLFDHYLPKNFNIPSHLKHFSQNDTYSTAAFVKWESTLMERLFFDEKRKLEFKRLYFERCYSSASHNPYNIIVAGSSTDENLCKVSAFRTFCNNEYNIPIKYAVSTSNTLLSIHFLLETNFCKRMGEKQIVFAWLRDLRSHGNEIANPMEYIYFFYNQTDFSAHLSDQQKLTATISYHNDEIHPIASFSFPLDMFEIYHNSLCYNLLIRERVWGDCYRWCGGEYENYNPEGALGVIVINNSVTVKEI